MLIFARTAPEELPPEVMEAHRNLPRPALDAVRRARTLAAKLPLLVEPEAVVIDEGSANPGRPAAARLRRRDVRL